ncbi:hypothetical protein [Roseivirga sp. 4D4]|uniref:hypothetical protein n=1 Tax=Roseivirga sp. 4D4 TaxID=1889784 RepID=UPI00147DA00F|nr:hypothetical protein [Roseivirga sp. 4D4]
MKILVRIIRQLVVSAVRVSSRLINYLRSNEKEIKKLFRILIIEVFFFIVFSFFQ